MLHSTMSRQEAASVASGATVRNGYTVRITQEFLGMCSYTADFITTSDMSFVCIDNCAQKGAYLRAFRGNTLEKVIIAAGEKLTIQKLIDELKRFQFLNLEAVYTDVDKLLWVNPAYRFPDAPEGQK